MKERTTVSVIVPVSNERHFIDKTIACIEAQTYASDKFECIVVDGSSTDGTREYLEKVLPSLRLRWVLLNNPDRIVPISMNIALRHAYGDIIVRIDGHCEIPVDYISRCVSLLSERETLGVGGPIETVGAGYIAAGIALGMSSSFGVGGSSFRIGSSSEMFVDTIPFPAYKREVINRIGLYDEELVRNQDDEYNYRVRKSGGRLLLSPDLKTRYYSRSTFFSLFKQYFQYGFWKVRVLQKHPRQMQWRQFVPFAFVIALLLTAVLAIASVYWPLLSVLAAYVLVNIAASVIVSIQRGLKYLPLLPWVFATLHLSYGTGFLFGLFRFMHRWGDRNGKVPAWEGTV